MSKMALSGKPPNIILKLNNNLLFEWIKWSISISDKEKVYLFGDYLAKMFTPYFNINHESVYLNEVTNFLNSALPMSFPASI